MADEIQDLEQEILSEIKNMSPDALQAAMASAVRHSEKQKLSRNTPEAIEYRKEFTRKRNTKLKLLRKLAMEQHPELIAQVKQQVAAELTAEVPEDE